MRKTHALACSRVTISAPPLFGFFGSLQLRIKIFISSTAIRSVFLILKLTSTIPLASCFSGLISTSNFNNPLFHLLNIYYPKGCKEIESIHRAFIGVYGKELSYGINLKPIDNSKSFRRDSVTVIPFKVNHQEPSQQGKTNEIVPSLGFKFIYDGKSICYGGDTAYCESLVKMAKDSDLAIIEAGATDEKVSDLHMTIKQASQIGMTARDYFLVHVPE